MTDEDQILSTNEKPTVGGTTLTEQPPEVMIQMFQHLSPLDRISLARCNKYLAKLAIKYKLLDTQAYTNPIFGLYIEFESASCGISPALFRVSYQAGPKFETACTWCGWRGELGKVHWFRHLKYELARLRLPAHHAMLQAIAYEVLSKSLTAKATFFNYSAVTMHHDNFVVRTAREIAAMTAEKVNMKIYR